MRRERNSIDESPLIHGGAFSLSATWEFSAETFKSCGARKFPTCPT